MDIPKKDASVFDCEMKSTDTFSEIYKQYRVYSGHTVDKLSERSHISVNTLEKYNAGHAPKSREVMVKLCIGLGLCPQKSEYLFSLAHLSIGNDAVSSVYKIVMVFAFTFGYDVTACNEVIKKYGFTKLK